MGAGRAFDGSRRRRPPPVFCGCCSVVALGALALGAYLLLAGRLPPVPDPPPARTGYKTVTKAPHRPRDRPESGAWANRTNLPATTRRPYYT